ncbi:hypothetical protein Tco_1278883 [Tanacetum coccineum]
MSTSSLQAEKTIYTSLTLFSDTKLNVELSTKGVGYSKDLVHVYEVKGVELKELTEIEAHDVHVSDPAFLTADRSLLLVTYGNEHIVKI